MIKNHKYIVFLASFIAIFGIFNTAQAMTESEIQTTISQLQTQVIQLQAQLAAMQGSQTAWCHDFNIDLRINNENEEVIALHQALEKEGFGPFVRSNWSGDDVNPLTIFTEETFSAVKGFQEKYSTEILSTYGLRYGTGYVGSYTRAQLNKLYGCKTASTTATSSITVLSPDGGEKWEAGKTYDIKWTEDGTVDKVVIYLYDFGGSVGTDILAYDIDAAGGQYSWMIPSDINPGSMLKIAVRDSSSQEKKYDISDNYFSIVNSATF